MVEYLINRGADVNRPSAIGFPTVLAAERSNVAIADLPRCRADVNQQSKGRCAALVLAAR